MKYRQRYKKLPNRTDPNFIQMTLKIICESPALLAAITAMARFLFYFYTGKSKDSFQVAVIDAFLCMVLTLCIKPAMELASIYFGFTLPEKAELAIAVFIGYLGTETIRMLIIKFVKHWLGIFKKDGGDYE